MDHIPTHMVSTVPPLYVVPVLSEASTLPTHISEFIFHLKELLTDQSAQWTTGQ